MNKNLYGWHRRHDERAFHRAVFWTPVLFVAAAFLGYLSYRTSGQYPFGMGTTVLLVGLSLMMFLLSIGIGRGFIILDSGDESVIH